MEHLEATLELINGQTWGEFQELVSTKLTPDQVAAISTATDIVKAYGSLTTPENKVATLKRAANKLADIAAALQLAVSAGGESGSEGVRHVTHAIRMLFESAGAYATPEAVSESSVILGGMTPEEVVAAQERAARTNIR